jgi:hypothetical protein
MADEQFVIGCVRDLFDDIALADTGAPGDEHRQTLRDVQREQFGQLCGRNFHDGFPEKEKAPKGLRP